MDVADPDTGERRTSDAWFASKEMKQRLQALAKNWACDYTQLLPPFQMFKTKGAVLWRGLYITRL